MCSQLSGTNSPLAPAAGSLQNSNLMASGVGSLLPGGPVLALTQMSLSLSLYIYTRVCFLLRGRSSIRPTYRRANFCIVRRGARGRRRRDELLSFVFNEGAGGIAAL